LHLATAQLMTDFRLSNLFFWGKLIGMILSFSNRNILNKYSLNRNVEGLLCGDVSR
jgi:hypothetical protein